MKIELINIIDYQNELIQCFKEEEEAKEEEVEEEEKEEKVKDKFITKKEDKTKKIRMFFF